MKIKSTFKCLNCKEKQKSDPRNRGRQRYCSKPECRKASKAASQRRWTKKPENKSYFSGIENCQRVRLWRLAHPGYWRKKKLQKETALQESSILEVPESEKIAQPDGLSALQEDC